MNLMQILTAFKAKDGLTPMFKKSAKQSALFTSRFGRGMRGLNAGVNKFMKVGVAAFAAVGSAALLMGRQVFKSIESIAILGDEYAKTSRRIGITAETLQELEFAADRQGVSGETLRKGLQKLNKNIGDLRANTGSLKMVLKETNPVLLEQLKNAKNNEEAFAFLVNTLDKTENVMDKTAIAQAAFGRAGVELLTVTEGGTAAIEELRKEARRLGVVMSEEASKQAEKFIDAQTNMNAAFKGLKITVLSGFLPAMTKVLNKIADFVAINKGNILKNLTAGFERLVSIMKFLWKNRNVFKVLAIGVGGFIAVVKVLNFTLMAYETISKTVAIATKIMTASQLKFNLAMLANPIGAVVLVVGALVAGFFLLAKRVGGVKNAFKVLFSFMKAGLFSIGQLIVNWFLLPIQGLLFMLSKIPGVGKKVQGAFEAVKGIRESINAGAASARAEAGQSARLVATGGSRPEKAVIDVNVSAQEGTAADVATSATSNINVNNMAMGMAQ